MNGNRVLLIGYVGLSPRVTTLGNGTKRAGIRVATHYEYRDTDGHPVRRTVWHDIVAWDGVARYAECSFVKGSRIMVEGMLDYRVFPGREGKPFYTTRIKATCLLNLDR